jgi:hypothetical protein
VTSGQPEGAAIAQAVGEGRRQKSDGTLGGPHRMIEARGELHPLLVIARLEALRGFIFRPLTWNSRLT